MTTKNNDYVSKFKNFLYDKSLEYDLYLERLENPPFKDIINFCDGNPGRLIDFDSNGVDERIRDRKRLMENIELFVDMSIEDGKFSGKTRENIISSYVNPLEVYRSMLLYCEEYGVSVENVEQGIILKEQLQVFYNDLNSKYLEGKNQLKSEYELLELKNTCEEAQKINELLVDDGSLLEPLEDYEMLFGLINESGLDYSEQEALLGKVLLSSLEVFQILEPSVEVDVMDYLNSNELEIVNYVRDIYKLNQSDYDLINNSDEVKAFINLYRDLKSRDQEIRDNYFGNYTKADIYRLMCLNNIDSYLNDFISFAKKNITDSNFGEYKDLCFSELVEAVSSFNEIQKEELVVVDSDVETLDVDLFDIIYLLDKNGNPYIEDELISTYNNKEHHKKISNMVLQLRNREDVSRPVVNYNKWPIFMITKGELALSYMNLGSNVKMVITVGDFTGNDDIYSKTNSIVNKNPEYINGLLASVNNQSIREQLIIQNEKMSQNVTSLLSDTTIKGKRV